MEIEPKVSSNTNAQQDNNRGKQSLRLKVVDLNRLGAQKIEIRAKDVERQQCSSSVSSDTSDSSSNLYHLVVEGIWTQGHIVKDTLLHLVNPLYDNATDTYAVNNSAGLLVIEPDNLLTCTLVASSLFCERKTWLNQVFLGQVGTNRAMLVGTLVHEVFQYGVKNRIADLDKLTRHLDELLDDATVMLEIYSVEMHLKDVRAEAIAYLSSVKEWIEKYMLAGPRFPLTNDENLEVKVIGVCDIEENVWSTKYGLKGKIDVTGAVRVYDRRTKTVKDKTLPLELKTGNPNLSASHAAQVSLYSMMIEDRYTETNQGLVIYLKDKAAMHNISLTHNIKRDLVQRRNQINYHLKSHYFGPEMIDQPRMCKSCDRLTECILMSKIYTPKELDHYPGMKSLENEATNHLDEKFYEFFKNYHEKLASITDKSKVLEGDVSSSQQSLKSTGSFWTYSSEEAELRGAGFGRLQATVLTNSDTAHTMVKFQRHPDYKGNLVEEDENSSSSSGASQPPSAKKQKIDDYFKPKKAIKAGPKLKPFNQEVNFSRCRIAVSLDEESSSMDSQNSSTAIAIGFMHELKDDYITIKLYEGTLDTLKPNTMFRLDRIEKRTNLDIERLVLVRLLTREDWRCDRVRQLILDPTFKTSENIDLNLFVLSTNFEEIAELDEYHQKAVVEAVSTDNYYILNESLIPNRAKRHKVIAVLTQIIRSLEKTVLIVAQNIDHLMDLMRLLQRKVRFVLIDDGKSTEARFKYASNLVKVPQGANLDLVKKYDFYIRQHEVAPVVITTFAMSIGGLLFTRRTFDYCIVYDCDSTELLVSLSPMFSADRHIIVDIQDSTSPNKHLTDTPKAALTKTLNTIDVKRDNVTLGTYLRALRPADKTDTATQARKDHQPRNHCIQPPIEITIE